MNGHRAMSPALLAAAVPGNRREVGTVYQVAAAWLPDGWLSERLHDMGHVLRDTGIKRPADALWKAARCDKMRRPALAARYRDAARGMADPPIPDELAVWLAYRLAAMAGAIGDMTNAKPANAVWLACGAGRKGKRGTLPADADQDARDAALAWDCAYRASTHPDEKQAERFRHVAAAWSLGTEQLSQHVVEDAWKRRRDFFP